MSLSLTYNGHQLVLAVAQTTNTTNNTVLTVLTFLRWTNNKLELVRDRSAGGWRLFLNIELFCFSLHQDSIGQTLD